MRLASCILGQSAQALSTVLYSELRSGVGVAGLGFLPSRLQWRFLPVALLLNKSVIIIKADSQYPKCSDQRPTTAPRPVAVLPYGTGVAGGRRDQNAEVEHGSTSATGDSVAGPVSIEM